MNARKILSRVPLGLCAALPLAYLFGQRVAHSSTLLVLLAGAALAFVLLYRVSARSLFLLFIGYLPLSLRLPVQGDTTLPSAFLLLYLSLARLLLFELATRRQLFRWSRVHTWAIVFLGLATLSTLTSIDLMESVRKMFYVSHFVLVCFAASALLRPDDLGSVLWTLAISMSLLALVGLAQFGSSILLGRVAVALFTFRVMSATVGPRAAAVFAETGAANWFTKFGTMRAVGLGVTAMQFSQNLMLAMFPTAAVALSSHATPRRRSLTFAFGLCLMGVVASFSRGAWLAAVVGLVVLIGLFFVSHSLLGRIGSLRFVTFGLLTIAVLFALLPGALQQNLADMVVSIVNIEGESTSRYVLSNEVRFVTYRVALEVIAAHPYLGVGPGNYATAAEQVPVTTSSFTEAALLNTPHNQFLMIAGDIGIPATLVYLLLALTACISYGRVALRGRDPTVRLISAGWCACLIALGLHYLFESNPYIPDVNCLLWAVAGISSVAEATLREPAATRSAIVASACSADANESVTCA
jgi:O-antigen ligase